MSVCTSNVEARLRLRKKRSDFNFGALLRCGWASSPAVQLDDVQLYERAGPKWSVIDMGLRE